MKWDDYEITIPDSDKLELLFKEQKTLMNRYGIHVLDINTTAGQAQFRKYMLALIEELCEIAHCLKNKPWTQSEFEVDLKAMYDEVADSTHFFIECMILLGLDPKKLITLYLQKNKTNHKRLDTKY